MSLIFLSSCNIIVINMLLFMNSYIKKIDTSVYMTNKDIVKINNETDYINRLKYDIDVSNKLSRGSMVLFLFLLTIHLSKYSIIVTF